jgi:hypothetical protein
MKILRKNQPSAESADRFLQDFLILIFSLLIFLSGGDALHVDGVAAVDQRRHDDHLAVVGGAGVNIRIKLLANFRRKNGVLLR